MDTASSAYDDACWICLQSSTGSPQDSALVRPCACPRAVHEKCLAKWQLHCAGKEEEFCCRFCKHPLPHWKQALQPTISADGMAVKPLMSIQFHGQTYWLQVHTGEGGVEQFKQDVRRLLSLRGEDDFDITFECQMPGTGGKVELHGLEAYDAAVYCASLTAAERLAAAAADADAGDADPGAAHVRDQRAVPGRRRSSSHITTQQQVTAQSADLACHDAGPASLAGPELQQPNATSTSSSSSSSSRRRDSSGDGGSSSSSSGANNTLERSRTSSSSDVAPLSNINLTLAVPGCCVASGDPHLQPSLSPEASWVLGRAASDASSYVTAWETGWDVAAELVNSTYDRRSWDHANAHCPKGMCAAMHRVLGWLSGSHPVRPC